MTEAPFWSFDFSAKLATRTRMSRSSEDRVFKLIVSGMYGIDLLNSSRALTYVRNY